MPIRSIWSWLPPAPMPPRCREFCNRPGRRSTPPTRRARSKRSKSMALEGASGCRRRPSSFAANQVGLSRRTPPGGKAIYNPFHECGSAQLQRSCDAGDGDYARVSDTGQRTVERVVLARAQSRVLARALVRRSGSAALRPLHPRWLCLSRRGSFVVHVSAHRRRRHTRAKHLPGRCPPMLHGRS